MFLVILSCLFVAGVFAGPLLRLPAALALLGLAPLPLLFYGRRYLRPVLLISLGTAVFFGAAAYSYYRLPDFDAASVSYYNDSGTVTLQGKVAGGPDVRDVNTRLTIEADYLDGREVSGRVLVLAPRNPEYRYGDLLEISGALETPPALDGFDYRGYLAERGIYATMHYPRITVLDTGRGLAPLAWIYDLRGRLAHGLAAALPEPQASLAQGIVLGIRTNIPADVREDFSRSGTAHLLAISGLHLGIMAGVMLAIGLWLFGRKRYLYVWLALGAVWFYTVITGLSPPVVRGAIMASLFLLAEALGRQRSAIVALTTAAAVMVGVTPSILKDASFQLSFLAMAGLIYISPPLRDAVRRLVTARLGEEGGMAAAAGLAVDALSVSLGATIAVWPVVAYYFGIVSLVGPLATFLALPALPGVILIGGLAALAGLVSLAAAHIIGWLAWPFLTWLVVVVGWLGAPAASSLDVAPFHPALVLAYYIALGAVIWLVHRRQRRRLLTGAAGLMPARLWEGWGLSGARAMIFPLLAAALLSSYAAAAMPGDDLRVSFLDVGEGDAILIQQGSRQVLVDGGPSPHAISLALGSRMPFWDRSIDLLVSTHPHQDHLAGLAEVLRRYRVDQVLYMETDYASSAREQWEEMLAVEGMEMTMARAGQRIDLGGGTFIDVLGPAALLAGTESDVDNNSLVLGVRRGAVSFLLTGDIMEEAERELLRERAVIHATVLKVAHHGSDTSSLPGFLAVASPEVAVISCGAGNRFGHPDAGVVETLEEIVGEDNLYRTDEHGTIDFTTDGERLWVTTGK